jgi:hypothetical protein
MIEQENSEKNQDLSSEISVMREQGGFGSTIEHKKISITLKSKNESIDDLLKKIEGVI